MKLSDEKIKKLADKGLPKKKWQKVIKKISKK